MTIDSIEKGRLSHRQKVLLGQLATVIAVLVLWEFASGRWVDAFFVSKPSLICVRLWWELFEPSFYNDMRVTAVEVFGGYAIGASGALFSACCSHGGRSPRRSAIRCSSH